MKECFSKPFAQANAAVNRADHLIISEEFPVDNESKGVVPNKKRIVIVIIIILLIILLLFGGIFIGIYWSSRIKHDAGPADSAAFSQRAADLDIDPNAAYWNGEQPENKGGEAAGIQIPGYPSITIAKDSENVRMALLNPEGNPCYFKFEIVLKDSNETIYASKLVPPGQAITDVTLLKPLSEGEYDAVIKISTFSLKDQSPMNGANVITVLIAQ